jgi:hypothetical protein
LQEGGPNSNSSATKPKKKQKNKIDKSGDITTDANEIQRIIRKHFENLHFNKLKNLQEIDKFLDAYD